MEIQGASPPPAGASKGWLNKADTWAGAATIALALAVIYVSFEYGLGRGGRIGPGYVPLVIGLLLLALGVLLVARAGRSPDPLDTDIAWRQVGLVTAGIVAFALLLDRAGVLVAIMTTVLIAGPAAYGNTLLSMLISGTILAAFSWTLFVHFLKISIPVWWF
jgi:vacuolar-type H+-ATPase subunit I/STV1